MAVKGIKFSDIKAKALANPEVKKAYEEETQEEELRAVLVAMKSKSGLTSTEIAARMGVSQPASSEPTGEKCVKCKPFNLATLRNCLRNAH